MKEVITRRWFLKRVIAGLGVGIASALGLQQLTGCSEISEGPVLSPALTEVEGPTPTATLERAPTYTPRPLHEAMFYRTLADDVVQCQVCFRECIVQEGRLGFCHNKKNVGGKYYSYNEPTVFYEQMFDTARLAKEKGLRALFHTNGTMNPEPLFALLEHMDAVTVDLKAFTADFYQRVSSS